MGFWISMSFKICNYVCLSLLASLIMCRDLFPVWCQDCAYWLLFLGILSPFSSTLCPIRQWFIIFSSLCSQLCKPRSSLLCGLGKVLGLKQDSFENKFITRPRGEVNDLWFFSVLGLESRASYLPDRCFSPRTHPSKVLGLWSSAPSVLYHLWSGLCNNSGLYNNNIAYIGIISDG